MSASTLTDAAKERQKSKELKKCMEAMLDRLRCRTLVTDGGENGSETSACTASFALLWVRCLTDTV